jgi:protein-export membrane protein SecD
MLYFAPWKIWSIVAAVVLSVLLALPNVLPAQGQAWLAEKTGARPMTLGLDLQGGTSVLYEVDRDDLRESLIKTLAGDVRSALRQAKISYRYINRTADGVTVRIANPAEMEKTEPILRSLNQPFEAGILGATGRVTLFEVTRDGEQFGFTLSQAGLSAKVFLAVDRSIEVLKRRFDGLGVKEVSIQRQGDNRILIQVPGVDNLDQFKGVIPRAAKLTFQLACEAQPDARRGTPPPPDCDELPLQEPNPHPMMWVQTSSDAIVDGADLSEIEPGFDFNNQPVISFKFNSSGRARFGRVTTQAVGKQLAIVLDGVVIVAPRVIEPILGGTGQISGYFTVDETRDLAVALRAGALPVKLSVVRKG